MLAERERETEKEKGALAAAAAVSFLVTCSSLLILTPPPPPHVSSSSFTLLLPPHPQSSSSSNPGCVLPLLHLISSSCSQILAAKRTRKRKGPPTDHEAVIKRTPDDFSLCFRMTSSSFEYLSGLLEPLLDCGPDDLRPTSRLAIALFRLATGCPYPEIASRFGVSEPTARSCTKRLCRVLCTNFRFWLSFPSDPAPISGAAAMPNCCGAIVSTSFRCADRTVVLQLVADSNSRILNMAAGHRGGLRSSSLFADVEAGKLLDSSSGFFLVGDESFPLLPWLMLPFQDPPSPSKEEAFNSAHAVMLRPALRTLNSLRNWGLLAGSVLHEDRKMAVACIATCSILHNALLSRDDHSALSSSYHHHGNNTQSQNAVAVDTKVLKEASKIRRALAETVNYQNKAAEC